jgi:hypothetical protein
MTPYAAIQELTERQGLLIRRLWVRVLEFRSQVILRPVAATRGHVRGVGW